MGRHGCLPPPDKWTDLWGKVRRRIRSEARAQLLSRAGKEGREEVKVVAEILVLPDKENLPLSETVTSPVVFKIPVSSGPRAIRKPHITVSENIAVIENIPYKENIRAVENISSKENIPVIENVSMVENISSKENNSVEENISSKKESIVGRHLPGSVTVACVTACEKSSNPRQKVGLVVLLNIKLNIRLHFTLNASLP